MTDSQNGVSPQTLIQQILQRAEEIRSEQISTNNPNADLDAVHAKQQATSVHSAERPKIKVWIEENRKPEFVPKHVRDSCLAVKQTLDKSTTDAVTEIEGALKKFRCKENRIAVPNILMYVVFIMLVWLLIFFGITIAYNIALIHNTKLMQVMWCVTIGMAGSCLLALAIHYKINVA